MSGWLLQQLPGVLAEDRVLAGFVDALQEVADSVRERVDGVEHQLDVDLASPEMLQYVAAWLGVSLDPGESNERNRALVRAVGRTLRWRGTRHGVETVLSAATGSRVAVSDAGGVFPSGVDPGRPDQTVVVEVDSLGGLDPEQVRAWVQEELPVGAEVRLVVGDQQAAEHSGHGVHP